uniref:Type II secretion system protein E (FlaI-A, flaI) n=1 Tax=uncultured marine group II/III euryarchaeote KM3_109_G01 TaxID=1457850 RepID=A0A075G6V8_9EURY|nr:type II secretion system protein E (flaI-A, flaI) [uncultured marine group II/III euryarchaeote KM3_109_G01]
MNRSNGSAFTGLTVEDITKGYSEPERVRLPFVKEVRGMARRKKGGRQRQRRRRRKQRPQYDELDKYPVLPPHAFARIVRDKRTLNIMYQVIEPPLTKKEEESRNEIMDIFVQSLTADIEAIDSDPNAYLRTAMDQIIKSYGLKVNKKSRSKIFYYLKRDLIGYGRMDVLMNDANVEDVSLDGTGVPIFAYHRKFESVETTIAWPDDAELEAFVIKLAQRCGKHISVAEPLLDATLMDGSRIVMKLGHEISTRGSTFCIRRFREDPFSPCDIIAFRTMTSLMVSYLWIAFQQGVSMLFVGGTASGKTTTLNAMCLFIPWQMKIVSIESTREVNIPHPNWIPGLTRQGFGGESDEGVITEFELLKAALRERPEYIIVGEIRGAEAYVLFQAMATGHCSFSTVHADSVPSLVHRLENKPIDIPRVLLPALEVCVIQIQTRINGRRVRRSKEIIEIVGVDPHTNEVITNAVFNWDPNTDDFDFSGKSYVLEKIMVKINFDQDEMRNELRTRKRVLDWMVLNDIRKSDQVAQIITEYYVRPQDVLARVDGLR